MTYGRWDDPAGQVAVLVRVPGTRGLYMQISPVAALTSSAGVAATLGQRRDLNWE